MAGRGSGIGLGAVGGLGVGGAGGSQTSLRTGSLYNQGPRGGLGGMQTHHWLWVLVAIEIGFLVFLRAYVFKNYHGG